MTDTVAYLRVSTEEQARDDRASMAQQRAACIQLATRLGRQIGTWFDDPGASGGSADRPGFQALVTYCRTHPRRRPNLGAIVCLNHSRWGRFPDPDDATWWRQEMKHVGWMLRFAEGGELEDSAVSPILNAAQNSQATAYREAIRANARRGWKSTAAQGFWQNEAPFGYRRLAIAGDGRMRELEIGQRKSEDERVKLTPGPAEEVRLVRWLFRQYAAGVLSCDRLAAEAYRRHAEKRWSKQVVRALLQNPAYTGDVVWGRRPSLPEGGRQMALSDPSGWITARAAHPALITRDLFDQVQRRFVANRGMTRLSAGGYPLSGLLTCAHCGGALIGGGGPKGPPGDPNRYRFYRHAFLANQKPFKAQPEINCPALMATVQKRIVEPAVIGALAGMIGSATVRRALERACDRALARLAGQPATRGKELDRRRAKLLAERERLVKLAGSGTLAEEEVAPRVCAIRAELAAVDLEAQGARFSSRRLQTIERERERILARASNFAAEAKLETGARLRELIRPWIQSAVVDRIRNVLDVAIQPIPADAFLLDSAIQPGQHSRVEKPAGLIRLEIPLPPARSMRRRA